MADNLFHTFYFGNHTMGKKPLKFVLSPDAIEEIKTTLLMQSELKKRQELEPILSPLEDMQIKKDTKKYTQWILLAAMGCG